jgi:hypothetical protein
MPTSLWQPGQSGNPAGRLRGSRNKLTEAVVCALLRDFSKHGEKAIAEVRRTQPGVYIKVLALLVPREHHVEHSNPLSGLSDEMLADMIADLEQRLARPADQAKVIEGQAIDVPALPAPDAGEDGIYAEADAAISERKREPARPAKRKPRQQAEGE